ncbi:thermonuclease family protein [Oceanobacillus kapialis]|uniref:Thermonuclease family protein n=1 Tax=Oceanobacillus kapialis TaxID=481353 RepID=A0ABW5PYP5_9BACI
MKKYRFIKRTIIAILITTLIVGCGTMEDTGTNATTPTETKTAIKEERNTSQHDQVKVEKDEKSESDPQNESKKLGDMVEVTRVVDGDTVNVLYNGKEETVRLLLVDTPETKHPSKPVQPFGPDASSFAKEILAGNQVQLEFDGPKRDKYDRLLAYLWIDGVTFNQMLLEQGLARLAYVYDPPYTHFEAYMKAQNRAKNSETGIWSKEGYVTDEGFYYQDDEEKAVHKAEPKAEEASNDLSYDPEGPDRDCGDFDSQQQAQTFYEAAGGPDSDPHRLDGNDRDGVVCESLP